LHAVTSGCEIADKATTSRRGFKRAMLIPDHETVVDFLNYEAIANTVVALLAGNRQRALTIGIHGDWGAGKSSILKMVDATLSEDKKVACLWFNGWTFQGFDDAKTVLIETTISELCRQRSSVGKVRDLGARLLKRIDYLKAIRHGGSLAFTALTGMPSPDMIDKAMTGFKAIAQEAEGLTREQLQAGLDKASAYLKPAEEDGVPDQIHHFREEFGELLQEAKIEQLVVIIDDLDRCLPGTAIATLEAIRLFLFVPKTAFVIGADEAMIEYAVRQHFPELPASSGPMPYARNYLEKLIQVPFRIPALGTQETKAYITLLLIESLVGVDHSGFKPLLQKARTNLNQPWLGTALTNADIQAVDPERQKELNAAHFLAQQIGPILAAGTRGNPRQIKRFLNALVIRQAIAAARGFQDRINQATLAKLMLAERFQLDFYEHLSSCAMVQENGRVSDLARLEKEFCAGEKETAEQDGSNKDGKDAASPVAADELTKWRDREWLQSWLQIEPPLSDVDLRPYIFVARDKRVLGAAANIGGLESLIEKLQGSSMAVRVAEPEVRALSPSDAEEVFSALREKVLGHGRFDTEPPGFSGMGIIAKHHPKFQQELVSFVSTIDVASLGIWIVRGWTEIITDDAAQEQLATLFTQWSQQNENQLLKKTAGPAVGALRRGVR